MSRVLINFSSLCFGDIFINYINYLLLTYHYNHDIINRIFGSLISTTEGVNRAGHSCASHAGADSSVSPRTGRKLPVGPSHYHRRKSDAGQWTVVLPGYRSRHRLHAGCQHLATSSQGPSQPSEGGGLLPMEDFLP